MLMERDDVAVARNKYLRIVNENRKSINPELEIYLDETWVNQNECVSKCWTVADGSVGSKLKSSKGARFITVHVGGDNGFVPCALLFFISKNGSQMDYHDTCFQSWFKVQLLPNIPPHSFIIMDNASYHSKFQDKR